MVRYKRQVIKSLRNNNISLREACFYPPVIENFYSINEMFLFFFNENSSILFNIEYVKRYYFVSSCEEDTPF
jgi:hypothetical protein